METSPGPLGLIGGDEFREGNEDQDERLVRARRRGAAYVIPTAAARHGPDAAADHCRRWFARFGLAVEMLPILRRSDALSTELSDRAGSAGFFYILGGDPGLVAQVLRSSPVGEAIVHAWRHGAALAGSSAGAMVVAAQVLVRASFPGSTTRRPIRGLGIVPESAVLPHHDTFGEKWEPSARAALPDAVLIGVDERTCALWEDGAWTARGVGSVTVHTPAGMARFPKTADIEGLPPPR